MILRNQKSLTTPTMQVSKNYCNIHLLTQSLIMYTVVENVTADRSKWFIKIEVFMYGH